MNVVVEYIKELLVKVSEKCEVMLQRVPSHVCLKGMNGRMSKQVEQEKKTRRVLELILRV